MRRSLGIAVAFSIFATVAYAMNPMIDQRQAAMKSLGRSTRTLGAMLKGASPFNLATVQASLKSIADESPKFKTLFPPDSKTGGDTEASAAIWTRKADFDGRFDKMTAAAVAAMATIKDEATFKSEWPKVGGACSGCHRIYKAD